MTCGCDMWTSPYKKNNFFSKNKILLIIKKIIYVAEKFRLYQCFFFIQFTLKYEFNYESG